MAPGFGLYPGYGNSVPNNLSRQLQISQGWAWLLFLGWSWYAGSHCRKINLADSSKNKLHRNLKLSCKKHTASDQSKSYYLHLCTYDTLVQLPYVTCAENFTQVQSTPNMSGSSIPSPAISLPCGCLTTRSLFVYFFSQGVCVWLFCFKKILQEPFCICINAEG